MQTCSIDEGEFHVLLLIFQNTKFVIVYYYGRKQISPIKLCYSVYSVIFIHSVYLALISNLLVANLFMHSLPGMILLYLVASFMKVLSHEILLYSMFYII